MITDKENNSKKLGLALSGGGFRATAFHIGTLRKLNELSLLDKIDVISSISGGSILSALYGLNKDNFEDFEKKARSGIKKGVIARALFLTWQAWLFYLILFITTLFNTFLFGLSLGILISVLFWFCIYLFAGFRIFPIGIIIYKTYDKIFFFNKTLKDLCEKPLIAINASNLESGRLMSFSKLKMSDSYYEKPSNGQPKIVFKQGNFPISQAVYASSCVPQFFSPLLIKKKFFQEPELYRKIKPVLIDGGIYDNQGLHKLTQPNSSYQCDYIIVSDAGNGRIKTKSIWSNNFWLMIQSIELFFTRVKNQQMINSIYTDAYNCKRVAYISLTWEIEKCLNGFIHNVLKEKIDETVYSYHGITEDEINNNEVDKILEKVKTSIDYIGIINKDTSNEEYKTVINVSTNLTSLSGKVVNSLIKRAEAITEIQIKLHCPDLIKF